MQKLTISVKILAFAMLGTCLVQAQATRTWVSGTGDDANPCSRTAPCKTLAGAISKTATNGEIDSLDPAALGALTITKAITIDGGGGQIAGILASGTVGITVNAGANDNITLRNLTIQGVNTGTQGIRFLAGKSLHIEHCRISQFTLNGIDIEPTVSGAEILISDTISQDNGQNGLYAMAPSASVQVTIDNSRFDNNLNGVFAGDFIRCAIRNSAASSNSQAGFIAQANSGTAKMNITNSTSANNTTGIQAGGGTFTASVSVASTSLFLNGTGFVSGTNGSVISFGNNNNSGSGTPSAVLAVQ